MGHLHSHKQLYRDLREHVDRTPCGFPDGEGAREILSILYPPEDAAIAVRMPFRPTSLDTLAKRIGLPAAELRPRLESMAARGLLADIHDPSRDRTYYALPPPVVGFLEMSMMRRHEGLDQKRLAQLFKEHLHDDPRFADGLFARNAPGEPTQIGRALVQESALADGDRTEVLDQDRASEILRNATCRAVSLCYCRHSARHLDRACGHPEEICLSLNAGAKFVVRRGLGREIDASEALDKLAEAQERGLVQIADNVAHSPTYICNCCGCCCGQLSGITKMGLTNAVHTSRHLARVTEDTCSGCGRCARACPIQAISLNARTHEPSERRRLLAKVDESVCLGCAVCPPACPQKALRMAPRARRVITPENSFARIVRMAIERKRFQYVLFDDMERWDHKLLAALFGAILSLEPVYGHMAREKFKSRFVDWLMDRGKVRGNAAMGGD